MQIKFSIVLLHELRETDSEIYLADVRVPFVCCKYHWLVKKLIWACDSGELSWSGKIKLSAWRKKTK